MLSLQQKGFCLWVCVIKGFQVPACVARLQALGVQLFYNGKQLNKEVKATSAVVLEHWGTVIQGSGMLFQASVPCSRYYFFSLYIFIYIISISDV